MGDVDRPRRSQAAAAAALVVSLALLALAGFGCGDDEDNAGAGDDSGSLTSTTAPPGTDQGRPAELPRNEDLEAVQCTGAPEAVFDATVVVGLTLEEALKAAEAQGCAVRETVRDGEALPATLDLRPDRVNVATEDGVVTRIDGLG